RIAVYQRKRGTFAEDELIRTSCLTITSKRAWRKAGRAALYLFLPVIAFSASACNLSLTAPNHQSDESMTFLLIRPVGGEVFQGGMTNQISWSAGNGAGSASVKIEVSDDQGSTWSHLNTVSNSGSYSWNTPSVDSEDYRVRLTLIKSDGSEIAVESVDNFAIDSTEPVVTLDSLVGG